MRTKNLLIAAQQTISTLTTQLHMFLVLISTHTPLFSPHCNLFPHPPFQVMAGPGRSCGGKPGANTTLPNHTTSSNNPAHPSTSCTLHSASAAHPNSTGTTKTFNKQSVPDNVSPAPKAPKTKKSKQPHNFQKGF